MPLTVETLQEQKWRLGKSFLFLNSELALGASGTDSIVIYTGEKPVALAEVGIESDSEILSWKAYIGTVATKGTGTMLSEIKRNMNADTVSGIEIELNPTIGNVGNAFFPNPISLVGQQGVGGRSYIDENLISTLFALQPNQTYLIEINNDDVAARRYDLNIDVIKD